MSHAIPLGSSIARGTVELGTAEVLVVVPESTAGAANDDVARSTAQRTEGRSLCIL